MIASKPSCQRTPVLFMLSLLFLCPTLFAQSVNCQTASGNWIFYYPTTITDSGGSLTVTQTASPCGGDDGPCTYTGTGTFNVSTGAFSFTITTSETTLIADAPNYYIYPKSVTLTGAMDEFGCNDLEETSYSETNDSSCVSWLEGYGFSAQDSAATCTGYSDNNYYDDYKPCDVPSGSPPETAVQSGAWDAVGGGAPWIQTLNPDTTNFAGHLVTEEDPTGGSDGCYIVGDTVDELSAITGGLWSVHSSNQWGVGTGNDGPDYVGYSKGQVDYYRNVYRYPCGTRFQQRMKINCSDPNPDGSWSTYKLNDLGSDIDSTYVSSIKNGSTAYNFSW